MAGKEIQKLFRAFHKLSVDFSVERYTLFYHLTFLLVVSGIIPKSRAHHGLTSNLRSDNATFSTSSLDMKSLLTHFSEVIQRVSPGKFEPDLVRHGR